MILVERRLKLAFTGDVYVNVREFTPEQAAFNALAPYLMTSVDSDPGRAAKERAELFRVLGPGEWLVFGGHGAAKKITI
jgi:sarcosine oxidase gamma subunit